MNNKHIEILDTLANAYNEYPSFVETIDYCKELVIKDNTVRPMLMQLAEPEYMCPKCGNKFYLETRDDVLVLDNRPEECKHCKAVFKWD